MTGNYKVAKTRCHEANYVTAGSVAAFPTRGGCEYENNYSVFRVNFMVKLLRACVWMPRRKKAMKDVASCDKLRSGASNLSRRFPNGETHLV